MPQQVWCFSSPDELCLTTIGLGGELDKGVQRHFDVRKVFQGPGKPEEFGIFIRDIWSDVISDEMWCWMSLKRNDGEEAPVKEVSHDAPENDCQS